MARFFEKGISDECAFNILAKRGHDYEETDLDGVDKLVFSKNGLSCGDFCEAFEQAFCQKFSMHHAFATMSCAHALDIVGKLTVSGLIKRS